jgi:GTPase SAR1 family protein
MPKVALNTIGSRYGSIDALNDNFDTIETAFDNTLSRDGTGPNFMLTPLDMNGYGIINASSITVNGVDYVAKLGQDYTTYSTAMQTIYNNYLSITQKVTVSTASPTGGANGDIWFKVST